MGRDATPNERRVAAEVNRFQSFSATLRVQYGEDGVRRRKSEPIASSATSGV